MESLINITLIINATFISEIVVYFICVNTVRRMLIISSINYTDSNLLHRQHRKEKSKI